MNLTPAAQILPDSSAPLFSGFDLTQSGPGGDLDDLVELYDENPNNYLWAGEAREKPKKPPAKATAVQFFLSSTTIPLLNTPILSIFSTRSGTSPYCQKGEEGKLENLFQQGD